MIEASKQETSIHEKHERHEINTRALTHNLPSISCFFVPFVDSVFS